MTRSQEIGASFRADQYPATTAQLGITLAYAIFALESSPLMRDSVPPAIQKQARAVLASHPDWNTPNWCSKCTPAGFGSCRCEIACNE